MLEGHFDRIRANVVDGWAWDSSKPDVPVCIEIVNEHGKLIAMGVADKYRADLHAAGKGNGAHGFSIKISPADRSESKLFKIRTLPHGYELVGTPVMLAGEPAAAGESLSPAASPDLLKSFAADRQRQIDYAKISQELATQMNLHRAMVTIALKKAAEEIGTIPHVAEPCESQEPGNFSDLVFFPPIDWDYRYQRPQQLAKELGRKGHRVFYVAPTFDVELGYKIYANPCKNVYLVRLGCPIPHPAINKEKFSPTQAWNLRTSFDKLCNAASMHRPIAILQNPVWHSLFNAKSILPVVYDCLDFFMGFESSSPSMASVEKELIKNATLVVTTSAALDRYIRSEKPRQRPILIRNACSEEFFSVPPPGKIKGRAPVIGYIGALEHWFDADLVVELARMHPGWNFSLAGNPSPAIGDKLKHESNIHLLGEIPIDEVPDLLGKFDICIIPFKDEEIVRYTNPVKAYEYLAAGRGVVATRMEELDQFAPFIKQASSADQFSHYLKELLLYVNNENIYTDRRLSVASETWPARAAALGATLKLLR